MDLMQLNAFHKRKSYIFYEFYLFPAVANQINALGTINKKPPKNRPIKIKYTACTFPLHSPPSNSRPVKLAAKTDRDITTMNSKTKLPCQEKNVRNEDQIDTAKHTSKIEEKTINPIILLFSPK